MGQIESLIARIDNCGGLNKFTEPLLDKMRAIEIESQWHLACEFLEFIEELFPDEFEEAYEKYKRSVF